MAKRVINFNAGPATLPLEVLQTIQNELLDYHDEGMSIMEMSHRSKTFDDLVSATEDVIRKIMDLPSDYHVLFMQGGATGQFAAVPLNLSVEGKVGEYVNTGAWSVKAIKETAKLNKPYRVIASSEENGFKSIPADIPVSSEAAYLHITSNNTIYGTQWARYPESGETPLIADMSSDFYCRRFDGSKFGLIYAGAQKNAGPSGVTIVIIRDDLLSRCSDTIPTVLNYKILAEKHSMYNTPNTFGIYVVNLVMNWILKNGGIDGIEKMNREKAALLYETLDASDFYRPHADKDSRSLMNVTWRLADAGLEKTFVEEALAVGLVGVKGHRSVGGIRASIYNAMTFDGVKALVEFMKNFEEKHG